MEISLGQQAGLLFFALLFGAFLGAVYDTVRITRILFGIRYRGMAERSLEHIRLPLYGGRREKAQKKAGLWAQRIFVFLGDLLFMIFSGVAFCLFLYAANDGEFRFFALLGILLGFLLYYLTLGRLVLFFATYIVFAVRVIFFYLSFVFLLPFRTVFRGVFFVFKKIRLLSSRLYGMIMRKLYSAVACRRLLKQDIGKMGINYGR